MPKLGQKWLKICKKKEEKKSGQKICKKNKNKKQAKDFEEEKNRGKKSLKSRIS